MSQPIAAKKPASTWVFVLLGALFLIIFTGTAGWKLFDRFQHGRDWQPITADVSWAGELCQMAYKRGKSWKDEDVVDCADVDAYKAAAPNRTWRSTAGPFVIVAYDASGTRREVLLPAHRASQAPLAAGGRVDLFVDPADPLSVDRALTDGDYREAALLTGIGVVAMVLTILIGSFILRANERSKSRKAAGKAGTSG